MVFEPKIEKVQIENFKLLKNIEINLTSNINIFIGQNSTGKTSLLQALTLGLLSKYSTDEINSENKNKYEHFIRQQEEESNITLYFDKFYKKVTLSKKEKKLSINTYELFVLAYGSNIFTQYDTSAKDVVEQIINKNIEESYAYSIFKDYTNNFWNPLEILMALDDKNNDTKKIENIKRGFIDTINYFLEEDFTLKEDNGEYFFYRKESKERLKLEHLSEGYRNNILLITDIMIKVSGTGESAETIQGVILIDEFDRHLHPKWQSKLVSKLKNKFKNIQFILTTHNPMAVLDRKADEIQILKNIDGNIMAKKMNGTKNIDVSTLLLTYFEVKSVVGESLQKEIKEFNRLRIKENLNKEEEKDLKNLKKKLLNSEFGGLVFDYSYLEYLKNKKRDSDFGNFDDIGDYL